MTMQNPLIKRGISDSASALAVNAGREYEFEDIDYTDPKRGPRTGHIVRCRLVKNSSGVALLPKYLVTFKAGTNRTEVDGYARTTAADGKSVVPVDEWLPSTGAANGEYFLVVVHGPAMCYMPASEVADISEEDVLVALTAAASTHSTTAGRVAKQDLTGATAVLGNQINGAFGRALSAKSSSSTNSNILVFVHNRWE